VRQAAHAELTWLNEREDREAGRDWADRNLNLTEVEQYYEVNIGVNVSESAVWVQISKKFLLEISETKVLKIFELNFLLFIN
jgi:hypothetical protein